jgi:bacterial/archaeal transporter family protein
MKRVKVEAWIAWALLAAVGWGLWGYAAAVAARHGSALGLLTGTVLLEAVVLLPWAGRVRGSLSWALPCAALLGLASYGFFYKALTSSGPPASVVGITAVYPAVTLAVTVLFLNERLTARKALGVIAAVLAVVLLAHE